MRIRGFFLFPSTGVDFEVALRRAELGIKELSDAAKVHESQPSFSSLFPETYGADFLRFDELVSKTTLDSKYPIEVVYSSKLGLGRCEVGWRDWRRC
jgi:hypothetical protein